MTKDEAMQQALVALENHEGNYKLGRAGCERQEPLNEAAIRKRGVTTHCQCEACKNGNIHDSDCSVHNGDALPVGPCDCSLAAPPLPVQEPVSMRMPKVGDKVICLEDESFGEVVSLTAGGSPDIKFADGSHGTYLLREFAELFGYVNSHQQQAEPPPEWPLIKNILAVFGLDAISFVAKWQAAQQAEPVMINGLTEAETNATASVVGLTKQAEPVTWDKPSISFDEWWDSDRHDNANPFDTDSFAYWAFEGWQAALAQRPWVGLTEKDYAALGLAVAANEHQCRAIEAKLKAKNHG